jgi:hypothetical protein
LKTPSSAAAGAEATTVRIEKSRVVTAFMVDLLTGPLAIVAAVAEESVKRPENAILDSIADDVRSPLVSWNRLCRAGDRGGVKNSRLARRRYDAQPE